MWEKTKTNLKLGFDMLVAAGKEFGADKVSRMAAAVAYRTMFALAPLLLLVTAIFGLVLGGDDAARAAIDERIAEVAGEQVQEALDVFLDSVSTTGDTAAALGLVLLLWTASSLFIELQRDLNDIFHVPQDRVSGVTGFVRKRLIGFVGVLGIGIALIGVWLINLVWRFLEGFFEDFETISGLFSWLAPLVSFLLVPVLFVATFQALTAVTVRWRAVWAGGVFTSAAFLIASYGAGLYFSWNDPTAPRIAASIFVILLLAFVLSSVFFYGAELTKVYDDYLDKGDVVPPNERVSSDRGEPEMVVAEPSRPVPMAAVVAFLGGLFVGRWRRR